MNHTTLRKTNTKNPLVKSKKTYTQNELVMRYLKTNRRAKLTTSEIAKGVNILVHDLGVKNYLSKTQVCKCLNRFCETGQVIQVDRKGTNKTSNTATRWMLGSTR